LIYYSRQKPKTEAAFHDSAALELLGEHKLCLMAPSKGYSRQNDNSPTVVESLEDTFYSILAKNGFKIEEESDAAEKQDRYNFEITKLLDISKLTKIGPDEYQGSHPVHDSTTE